MDTRASTRTRLSLFPVLFAFILNLLAGPLLPLASNSTALALGDSSFNALDGNQAIDGGVDWCTPGLAVTGSSDLERNDDGGDGGPSIDDSFKSSDERDPVPQIDFGSISNSTDYRHIYAAGEVINGKQYAYVSWVRWDTNGTGTMSFELNQSGVLSSNGVTYLRSDGDVLIEFNIQKSADNWVAHLTYRIWSGNGSSGSWSDPATEIGGFADASMNNVDITDCLDINDTIVDGAFGEFAVDLTGLLGDDCAAFTSILASSRASNSLTAALDDLAGPIPVDFNTCGEITINKVDPNQQLLGGATFSISPNPFGEATDPLSVTDNQAPDDDPTAGVIHLNGVEPGTYEVCETDAPDGYIGTDVCQTKTVGQNGSATYTFENGLGQIAWTKVDDESGAKICCAEFTLEGVGGAAVGFGPITVIDNGTNDEDTDPGELLVTGLKLGTYRITETKAPDGYALPSTVSQDVTLGEGGAPIREFRDPPVPVLEVAKTPDQGSATSGDTTGFTIVTTNHGPGTAQDVTLSDPLPAVANGWTVSTENWDGDCTITGDAGEAQTLTCGPEDLAKDASRSVTVVTTFTDSDCDQLDNTATADGANTEPADDSGSIDPLCPSIDVDKTPDDGTVDAPGTATFSIVTTNTGDGEARNTTLSDDLPDVAGGWTIVDAETDWADCAITGDPGDGQQLTCGPETIAAAGGDNTRTVTVSASVTTADCGPLPNSVEVLTSNDGSDTDEGLITVRCPELSIEKTTTTPEVNAGDDVSYTITVVNGGDGPANDVVITDDLPDGITWSETADECEINDGQLSCGPMTIAASSSFSVTVTGTTDAGECPSIENSATFTSSNADGDTTSPVEIIVNCPDLLVEKGGSSVVVAGDQVEFTLHVTNHGDGDAYGVVLTDTLPDLGSGTWAITLVEGTDTSNCEIAGNVLTCNLAELAAGADFGVVLNATSDPEDCPNLANDAEVSATNEPTDAQTQADNQDSHTITVNCPDTSILKSTSTPTVNAGDEATFTITATAGGSGTNEAVTVTDQLIGSALDWSFQVSGAGSNDDCSIDASAFLLCEFGDLAPGASVSIELTYQTDADDCPSIANTALVSATDDVDRTNNASDEVVVTVNCPDVTVDKEPVESPISAGEQGQFTIEVSNDGPGTAYDVEVEDSPEAGTTWTVLDDGGFDCSSSEVGDQQTLTCTLDELAANGSATILIGYTTSTADCGEVDNAVLVSAGNEPEENEENNSDEASIIVECPGLNLVKQADATPIDAGDEASFTITLWNNGGDSENADAFDVELHDDLPAGLAWDFEIVSGDATDADCMVASSLVDGGVEQMSIDCDFGTLEPTDQAGGIVIRVFAQTDRTDCGQLENTATADASNLDEPLTESAKIDVHCPEITLDKENDAVGSVLPGTTVTYTLTLTVSDGPADGVTVVDVLPDGLESPTGISDGGAFDGTDTITWDLGVLADGTYTLTYQAVVADDVENGDVLVNAAAATSPNSQCPDLASLADECDDESNVEVRVPTLVIDKVADTELITISGPNDDLVATPAVVTWTLTYTLTNGPVTNAVITDEIPAGFVFLDAADGGAFADGTVTWTFATLSESGSVTFRTTVDPETISRAAPTVNVAVIDSDETAPDEGQDDVRVAVEPPPLAGTPTPKPSLPNTAIGTGPNGQPITVPIELLVAFFIGSLGALALANVKARSRRR